MSDTKTEQGVGSALLINVQPVTPGDYNLSPVSPHLAPSADPSPEPSTDPSTSAKRSATPPLHPPVKRRYARRKITPKVMVFTLDTLMAGVVSSPLTALQQRLLDHIKSSLPQNALDGYYDISVAFKDFVKDEITSTDRLTKLLGKGGNAFFNHFMFTMYWGRDWRFATNESDMLLYKFDRTDWRGIHMAALCYPHIYRLMYRYVVVRVLDHVVLLRGQSWHMDPYIALLSGKEARTVGGECIDKGCNRSIVMLESLCRCLVHQPLNYAGLVCRCCDDFDYYKKNTYFM